MNLKAIKDGGMQGCLLQFSADEGVSYKKLLQYFSKMCPKSSKRVMSLIDKGKHFSIEGALEAGVSSRDIIAKINEVIPAEVRVKFLKAVKAKK